MPLKKDEQGQRWVEMQLFLPGTPEQVWEALATGPGNSAWFAKAEIDGRVGGKLVFEFGPDSTSGGEVTAWEPPRRFAYVERDWAQGAPPVATEITITGRAGNRCVVRMVHSLFASTDAWDDQLEGFEAGWPGFFAVLRAYLGHFSGARAASFMLTSPATEGVTVSWRRLRQALGVHEASVGERTPASLGPEGWLGLVEHLHEDEKQRYLLLRLEAPSPGLALLAAYDKGEGATTISVSRYFYAADAAGLAASAEPAWRAWLAQTFAG